MDLMPFIFAVVIGLVGFVFMYLKNKQYDFYLAGPMRNIKNNNKKSFDDGSLALRNMGYTVWNPSEENDSKDTTFEEWMIKDLNQVINKCKRIALLPGWRDSIGANVEAMTALVCNKDIYELKYSKKNKIWKLNYIKNLNYCLPFNSTAKRL